MPSVVHRLSSLASALLLAGGLLAAAPVAAVPVSGSFTAQIIGINGDDVAASPYFTDQAIITGSFGYDTDAASDTDPSPDRGFYTFTDTAFVSITANGVTYTTDPALAPITVSVSIFPGNQSFLIRGGLVPQDEVPLATADVPLEITLANGLFNAPLFVPSDALPTSTFSLETFSDPNGSLGGAGATPYLVFFQLRSLSISTVAPVPEPAPMLLLLMGVLAIGNRARQSRGRPRAMPLGCLT